MKQIIIGQEELLKLFREFVPWSGRYLVRLFELKDGVHPLGSGGLLKYKDRYFVLTNAHVIKDVEDKNDIRIPYTINDSQTYSMVVIDIKYNVPDDIAKLKDFIMIGSLFYLTFIL
ncbi:serine protease [Bacillus cereus]|uniref:serine protease n=1 Tax=Bacillus cereus TaxID=1396 RepID=UPI001D0D49A7|nr:serine protease [Bacillus cereus]